MGVTISSLFKSFSPPGLGLVDKADLQSFFGLAYSGAAGITALVGGTAVTSPVLSAAINQVDTSTASGTDSVTLPDAHLGQTCTIINNTANTIRVWANPSNADNGNAADLIVDKGTTGGGAASVTIATAQTYDFYCAKAGVWKAVASG